MGLFRCEPAVAATTDGLEGSGGEAKIDDFLPGLRDDLVDGPVGVFFKGIFTPEGFADFVAGEDFTGTREKFDQEMVFLKSESLGSRNVVQENLA